MYLASHHKSSLENIQPNTYTDVIVMVGINNVKRPGLKEWQDKKLSDKLVIQSYRLTPQFHGIVLHTDLLTFLLTYFSKIMSFKNI